MHRGILFPLVLLVLAVLLAIRYLAYVRVADALGLVACGVLVGLSIARLSVAIRRR